MSPARLLGCAMLVAALATPALAAPPPTTEAEAQAQMRSLSWQRGPADGHLGGVATLKITEGQAFLDSANTRRFLELTRNPPRDGRYALVAEEWFAIFFFEDSGYVRDDEKLDLDGLPVARARALRAELLRAGTADDGETVPDGTPAPEEVVASFEPSWLRYAPLTGSGVVIAAAALGLGAQFLELIGFWRDVDSEDYESISGPTIPWQVLVPVGERALPARQRAIDRDAHAFRCE